MNPSRAVPLVLVSLMILMEIYASRLRRTEAKTDDRGSFLAVWLLVAVGYGAAFSMWNGEPRLGPSLGPWALWTGATGTRVDKTSETLAIIDQEIARFAATGPTEEELAKTKSFLQGSYALAFDTSTKIASILLQNQLDDLGIDYIDKRNALMDAVTIEDARRAAKRLAEGGMLVTVVGQPKGLASKEPGG